MRFSFVLFVADLHFQSQGRLKAFEPDNSQKISSFVKMDGMELLRARWRSIVRGITRPSNLVQESAMKMMLADCRVKVTVDVIRGKWKPIIIKALKDRTLGYAELRRIVPEPTKKVLTDHLRELEADRIISRAVPAGRNGRSEYSLTEYGRTLIPVLAVMRAWGQTHREQVLGHPRDAEDGTAPCAIPLIPAHRRVQG
jgi:DNA-binding HxlR family transcriptional regulator